MVQVTVIKLIGISLALERNPLVRRIRMEDQAEHPFEQIEDIEEYVSKLLHLSGMNRLVIQNPLLIVLRLLVPAILANKHNPEQIDRDVTREGDDITLDYFHFFLWIYARIPDT